MIKNISINRRLKKWKILDNKAKINFKRQIKIFIIINNQLKNK